MTNDKTKRAWTPPATPSPMNTDVENVVFIDIETVPKFARFKDLDQRGQKLFIKKFNREFEGLENNPEDFDIRAEQIWAAKAALTFEFSQIACITLGLIVPGPPKLLRVKSFVGKGELEILKTIEPRLLNVKFMCAHNGKRFDFPLLIRKYIQYGLSLPSVLQVTGLKPWEFRLFDTMELWAFGNYEFSAQASLDSLAYALHLPSPKTEMSGADVAPLFYGEADLPWEEEDALKKIATYCEGDVLTVANAYLRIIGQTTVSPENVVIV